MKFVANEEVLRLHEHHYHNLHIQLALLGNSDSRPQILEKYEVGGRRIYVRMLVADELISSGRLVSLTRYYGVKGCALQRHGAVYLPLSVPFREEFLNILDAGAGGLKLVKI